MPFLASLRRIPADIYKTLGAPELRQLLLWCLPAVVIGFAVRGWLLLRYPYGYIHPDSEDFLITTDFFLRKHHFILHGKKAFLGPFLFTLPLIFKIPPLLVIHYAQHFFGLIYTVIIGALVRLWTRAWRAWIIPATVLATSNPAMLWYEHTLISEFQYLWCVAALCLAGTLCALRPSPVRFVLLLVMLILTAGSRPEGKLYVVFCILLVLFIRWGNWRMRTVYAGLALIFCIGTWFSTRNTQAGLLLYATVLPLAPEVPHSAPDFAPFIDPIRQQRIAQGPLAPDELTTAEKQIDEVVIKYLKQKHDSTPYGTFCQRLSVEAALNKPFLLPIIVLNKFLLATTAPPSGDFSAFWMQEKQLSSTTYKDWMVRLMPRLVGPRITSQPQIAPLMPKLKAIGKNSPEFALLKRADTDYVKEEFPPMEKGNPFNILQHFWADFTTGFAVGRQRYPARTVPGMPVFFILAAIGMAVAISGPGPLRGFHFAWIVTLGFLFSVVMLTGVINPRYRFVFEPFCILYICILLDLALSPWLKFAPKTEVPPAAG